MKYGSPSPTRSRNSAGRKKGLPRLASSKNINGCLRPGGFVNLKTDNDGLHAYTAEKIDEQD